MKILSLLPTTIQVDGSDSPAYISLGDYEKVTKYDWFLNKDGYPQARLKRIGTSPRLPLLVTLLMHQLVMERKPGFDIHHKNGDKLNNTRSNLVHLSKEEHGKIHGIGRLF